MLASRVFRDFSMEDVLGREVMEGLTMTTQEELECSKEEEELECDEGRTTRLLLKVHVLAVAKLRAALVELVSQGQELELHLEDLRHRHQENLKTEMKVDDATNLHDVCCQTTEDDITDAERKWSNVGTRKSLLEPCDVEAPSGPHNICLNHVLCGSLPLVDQDAAACAQTTENDLGLIKRTSEMCVEDSNLSAEGGKENSPGSKCAYNDTLGGFRECDDKASLKKEVDQVKIESSDVSDISGRVSVSDETKDLSDHDSERTEKKKKHKHKARDKSRLKKDRHRKRSGSRKTRVRKESSKDRKTKHGDCDSEVKGGEEDRAWDWNSYYEGWTRTGTNCDDGVRAWDQSEYGGGVGEEDSVGGWDLSGTESIAQQVERAATAALQGNSFVYDEQLGLYYDYSSGYYYNSEHGLYYDGKTGTYFFYDHVSKTYKFHSQVAVPSKDESKQEDAAANNKENVQEIEGTDAKEEGECSDSDNEGTEEVEDATDPHDEENTNDHGTGRDTQVASPLYGTGDQGEGAGSCHVPPSLRLMVVGGGSDTVKVGTLHLVTLSGGTVGREKTNLVELPDITISKTHAEFSYSSEGPDDHHYFVKDLGSSNGTVVNGTRLSQPHQPSEPVEVGHGWVVEFGTVQVVCHIHPGYLTCNECEPGIVLSRLPSEPLQKITVSKEKSRKKQLNAMRKKYALSSRNEKFIPEEAYVDRAQKRRTEVGSDNPYEKTEIASTEFALRENNKGFGMLQKMGWSEGTALGKSQTGITEPIQSVPLVGRAGLGSSQLDASAVSPNTSVKKRKRLNITKQRFIQASKDT